MSETCFTPCTKKDVNYFGSKYFLTAQLSDGRVFRVWSIGGHETHAQLPALLSRDPATIPIVPIGFEEVVTQYRHMPGAIAAISQFERFVVSELSAAI